MVLWILFILIEKQERIIIISTPVLNLSFHVLKITHSQSAWNHLKEKVFKSIFLKENTVLERRRDQSISCNLLTTPPRPRILLSPKADMKIKQIKAKREKEKVSSLDENTDELSLSSLFSASSEKATFAIDFLSSLKELSPIKKNEDSNQFLNEQRNKEHREYNEDLNINIFNQIGNKNTGAKKSPPNKSKCSENMLSNSGDTPPPFFLSDQQLLKLLKTSNSYSQKKYLKQVIYFCD
jgi:hypothetical protein